MRKLMLAMMVVAISVSGVVGCAPDGEQARPPLAGENSERPSSPVDSEAKVRPDELELAIRKLKRATDELLTTMAGMKEFCREIELGERLDQYPDEVLSLDIESEGESAWTVVDSLGRSMRSGPDPSVDLSKEQVTEIFQRLRRVGTAAADPPPELIVSVHVRVPDDGMRLTYRRRAEKKRISIRCTNDEKVTFSEDCDAVLRILTGEMVGADSEPSESPARPPGDAQPAALSTARVPTGAMAISECTRTIQDANTVAQRALCVVELVQRAGDPLANESVSYEFELPELTGTLILDSNGWLTIHDGVNSTPSVRAYSETQLHQAFDLIRRAVDSIPGDEHRLVTVKVARNFYKKSRSTVTYRNRLTNRTYRFKCATDNEAVASPEIDHIISIFYATAKW